MIVYGEKPLNFARAHLGMPFEKGVAIGFADNGKIQGCVVFDDYKLMADGSPCSMEASVLVLDKKCITRYNLARLFAYCFVQVGLKSLIIRCGRFEIKKRSLIERMGFSFEGISRNTWPYGGDAMVFSMLPHECWYL